MRRAVVVFVLLWGAMLQVGMWCRTFAEDRWSPFDEGQTPGRTGVLDAQRRGQGSDPVLGRRAAPAAPAAEPDGRIEQYALPPPRGGDGKGSETPGRDGVPDAQREKWGQTPGRTGVPDVRRHAQGSDPILPVFWQGLDGPAAERLLGEVESPERSPALHALWRRLLTARTAPPAGAAPGWFIIVRATHLARAGLVHEASELLRESGAAEQEPALLVLRAGIDIALGNPGRGCAAAQQAAGLRRELPKALGGEVAMLAGYCAAARGDRAAVALAADLAREEGYPGAFTLAALDAAATGERANLGFPRRLSPIDFRLLQLSGAVDPAAVVARADAALLALLANDPASEPHLRVAAGEAAARLNAIPAERLAEIYRSVSASLADIADPQASRTDPVLRRALLFRAAETERTPMKRARIVRALVDEVRRSGLALQMLPLLAAPVEDMRRAAEIGWFAETAVEVLIAAGKSESARGWAMLGSAFDGQGRSGGLLHWLALAATADSESGGQSRDALSAVEEMALRGRFQAGALHRLATVLDALDIQVPIPLWEAASRTPQPSAGHLPATGVLTALQHASSSGESGRTVLLALKALGPAGPDGTHVMALGDAIRALRRVGLEAEARRIAFEALFASWPRSESN